MLYLWVAIGGAIGSVARFWLGNVAAAALGPAFPWGTLMINVLGSFVISFFSGLTGMGHRFALPNDARILVTVGVCGGFTTFSSFSLQTVELARSGQAGRAAFYVAASMVICLAACAFGVWAASAINQQVAARA
jgi:fluoride exporter